MEKVIASNEKQKKWKTVKSVQNMPHITNSYVKQTKTDFDYDDDENSVSSIIPNVIKTYIKIPIEKPKITGSK
jgi:hypothetical protein